MVSAEVTAALAEEVRIAITAETQRMPTILEDTFSQASRPTEANMTHADGYISNVGTERIGIYSSYTAQRSSTSTM